MSINKPFHLTPREQFALTSFFVGSTETKDRQDRRRYTRAVEELGLDQLLCDLEDGKDLKLANAFPPGVDVGAPLSLQLSSDTVDFLLEKFNVKIPTALARMFLKIEERLLSVKEETYKSPFNRLEAVPAVPNT